MKKPISLVIGCVFVVLGVLLLLRTLGVASFPIWGGFATYWPLGLMLAGVALIAKQKWLGIAIAAVTFILAMLFITHQISVSAESRHVVQVLPEDNTVDVLNINMKYGAGMISIGPSESNNLVDFEAQTYDMNDPEFDFNQNGGTGELVISRRVSVFPFGKSEDTWNLDLSPKPVVNLDIHYGAGTMEADFNALKVNKLTISSGASKDSIIFGNFPTKATIETGASELDMTFPTGANALVTVEGGALSSDFNGFMVDKKQYKSPGFDPNKDYISVTVHAGASKISGEFR
jgi:hypothetical protein